MRGSHASRGAPPSRTRALPVVGWTELVDLPDWHIRRLPAKVDTGARSSALHVEHLEEFGHGRVRFDVRLHRRKHDRRVHVVARIVRRGRVRSSSGHYTTRIFVRTRLRIGPVEKEIEIGLVDRGKMLFRMLLGRTALHGAVLIDPSHRRLLSGR